MCLHADITPSVSPLRTFIHLLCREGSILALDGPPGRAPDDPPRSAVDVTMNPDPTAPARWAVVCAVISFADRGAEGLGQDKGRLQSVFFAVLNDNKTYTTQKSVYVLSLRRPHEVRR